MWTVATDLSNIVHLDNYVLVISYNHVSIWNTIENGTLIYSLKSQRHYPFLWTLIGKTHNQDLSQNLLLNFRLKLCRGLIKTTMCKISWIQCVWWFFLGLLLTHSRGPLFHKLLFCRIRRFLVPCISFFHWFYLDLPNLVWIIVFFFTIIRVFDSNRLNAPNSKYLHHLSYLDQLWN